MSVSNQRTIITEGYNAYKAGKTFTECPYKGDKMIDWCRGWKQAKAESKA